jgi:hypothetical protein
MTRTRTQTALTRLVRTLANINGELALVNGTLCSEVASELRVSLEIKHQNLTADRVALCIAIMQFDPTLRPDSVGML